MEKLLNQNISLTPLNQRELDSIYGGWVVAAYRIGRWICSAIAAASIVEPGRCSSAFMEGFNAGSK